MTLPGATTRIARASGRLFRILGYGGIGLLLGVLLASVYEPIEWSEGTGTLLTRIVLVFVLIEVIVLTVLYYFAREIPSVSSPPVSTVTLRWLYRVRLLSLISFSCILGIALGLGDGLVGLFLSLPFWMPCLIIFLRLRGSALKAGLALAVAMGCTLFVAIAMVHSFADDWSVSSWIVNSLALATLAPLIMSAAAIRTYYTMTGERGDLSKLLWSSAYGSMLLLFVLSSLPANGERTSRHETIAARRLEVINSAASAYAKEFGGVYPKNLAALEAPHSGRKADCEAAGLLEMPSDNHGSGYTFEYISGPPTEKIANNCFGAKTYTVIARPIVFEKTGRYGFYTDESQVIRYASDNRPPTATDPFFYDIANHRP
jgi:hypothetical protein